MEEQVSKNNPHNVWGIGLFIIFTLIITMPLLGCDSDGCTEKGCIILSGCTDSCADGHEWTEWSPYFDENGNQGLTESQSHRRICEKCDEEEYADHSYGEYQTIDSEYHQRKCEDCGYLLKEKHSFENDICKFCKYEHIFIESLKISDDTINLEERNLVKTAKVIPEIIGESTLRLEEGYTKAEYPFSIKGNIKPNITLMAEVGSPMNSAIVSGSKVIIPSNLPVGTYRFTLVMMYEGTKNKSVTVIVEPKPTAPTIEGKDSIPIEVGYKDIEYSFSVKGYPTPELKLVGDNTAHAVLKNGKITIPSGLEFTPWYAVNGPYSFTIQAKNAQGSVEKKVSVILVEPLVINMTDTIKLEVGYNDTLYDYEVTGYPVPKESIQESNSAKAVLEKGKVKIPKGLSVGSYEFTLEAKNDFYTAEHRVTVIVEPQAVAPTINGENEINLTEGYQGQYTYTYSVTGCPKPTITLIQDNNLNAVLNEGNVIIPHGLSVGTYHFTLQANNLKDTVTKQVQINVNSSATKPTITGSQEIKLFEGYEQQSILYTLDGYAKYGIQLETTSSLISIDNNTLIIQSGLQASDTPYTVTLRAENGKGTTEYPVNIYVYPQIMLEETKYIAVIDDGFERGLTASGGAGGPYAFELYSGELPEGLSIDQTYSISGIPTGQTGSYSVRIKVTDCEGNVAYIDVTIELISATVTD